MSRNSRCLVPWLSALALVFAVGTASADGPVTPFSLPGGVVVNDSDTGSGEQWGRGVRTITFSVNNPGDFTELSWGVVAGTVPEAAFDGIVNPGTPERMTLDPLSPFALGTAVWTGSARVRTRFGTLNLPTRFTLTVSKSAGGPVPLVIAAGGVDPGIDVLSAGDFRATMRFEAMRGTWQPLINVYDGLNTFPGGPPFGPTITGISTGFYFEGVDLSVEEHDTNITNQLTDIAGDISFLEGETVGRLELALTDLTMLKTQVLALPTNFDQEFQSLEGSIDRVREGIQEALFVLFGLFPCPPDAPQEFCDAIDQGEVEVEVVNSSHSRGKKQKSSSSGNDQKSHSRWLIQTTLGGRPVDVTLSQLLAVTVRRTSPATVADITGQVVMAPVGPGLYDLVFSDPRGLKNVAAFSINVEHDKGTGIAHGSTFVSQR